MLTRIAAFLLLAVLAHAQLTITPTTTLAAEVGNNTAAPMNLANMPNGNPPPASVSKVPLRSLLYPEFNGLLLIHYMPWWGSHSHADLHISEHDRDFVRRQVEDMISRGFDGVIITEWNSNDWNTETTRAFIAEVAKHPNFQFALMENKGGLKKSGDPTGKLISDLQYANDHYFSQPNYIRIDGRPLITFFDADIDGLNWARAKKEAAGNPLFVFRNAKGFRRDASDGAFAWTGEGKPGDPSGLAYLEDFYRSADGAKVAIGSAYKGFNDSLASWSKGKVIPQRCGRTWLDTIGEANRFYNRKHQLQAMQFITWNDYEEGTALETGIDNCAVMMATLDGPVLRFSPNFSSSDGTEATIDHYTVFVSQDGQRLMPLADVAAGTHQLDLRRYQLAPGNYSLFVKMVGRPMIRNQMSAAVPWVVAAQPAR